MERKLSAKDFSACSYSKMTCQHCKKNWKTTNKQSRLFGVQPILFSNPFEFLLQQKDFNVLSRRIGANDFSFRLPWSEIGKFKSQIVGFSKYLPLTNKEREKKRKVLTISASTKCTDPIEKEKYSVFTAGISSVAVFYVELCLFIACVFVFFLSHFFFDPRLSTYSTGR